MSITAQDKRSFYRHLRLYITIREGSLPGDAYTSISWNCMEKIIQIPEKERAGGQTI